MLLASDLCSLILFTIWGFFAVSRNIAFRTCLVWFRCNLCGLLGEDGHLEGLFQVIIHLLPRMIWELQSFCFEFFSGFFSDSIHFRLLNASYVLSWRRHLGLCIFVNLLIWLLPKPKFFSHLGGILGALNELWWIYGIGLIGWSPLDFQIFDAVHIQVKNSVSEGVLNYLNLHLTSSFPWLDVHWFRRRFFFFDGSVCSWLKF